MKITKKELKQLINEVALGGVGPGFHGFQPKAPVNEVEYHGDPLDDIMKEAMSILRSMDPMERSPRIYEIIDELEDLAARG